MNTMNDEERSFAAFMDKMEGKEPEKEEEEEPAKEPEQAAAPEVQTEKPQTETQQDEPFPGFNALPDEVKASLSEKFAAAERAAQLERERNDFQNRWKAQHGQLAPIQKQNEELRRMLAAQPKPAPVQVPKEKLDEYRKTFPEESEVVLGLVNPLTERLQQLEQERVQMHQQFQAMQAQAQKTRDLAELGEFRPTWRQDLPMLEAWIQAHDPDEQEELWQMRKSESLKDVKRLWHWFGREEELSKMAQPAPTRARKPDVDPNPRNRQSTPSAPVNAMGPEEERFAQFSDDYDKRFRR